MFAARNFFTALAIVVCLCSTAFSQISLTNGDTSYSWNASTGAGVYSDSRYGGSDVMVQELWLIRFVDIFGGGATEYRNLDPDDPDVTVTSDPSEDEFITFAVVGTSGDPTVGVRINFSMDSDGQVSYDFLVTDQDLFPATHTISLFNYFDVDLAGTNSATASASNILFTSTNGTSFEKTAVDADNFQVGAPFNIDGELTSDVNFNLNGNTAASGNVSGAFQWDHTIPNNGTYAASGVFAVPEPSLGVLGLIAMAGIGMLRRRRL